VGEARNLCTHLPSTAGTADRKGKDAVDYLGAGLRRVRQAAGMTLQSVATRAGVSKGYLSKVESGQAVPSIAVVSRIVDIYGLTLSDVFMPDEQRSPISLVRADERTLVDKNGSELGYVYAIASARKKNPKSQSYFLTLPPLEDKEPPQFRHPGEEVIVVLEGRMKFQYGHTQFDLGPGDCIQFDANIEHHGVAAGGEPAKLFVVIIPDRAVEGDGA
jgi:transcriptional regulator with XRE-family HTH domain